MEKEIDYNIGVRIRRSVAMRLREKAHEEFRSFNGTLNMVLQQGLKKSTIENLVEEVQKNTYQIELLTATIDSLSKQVVKLKGGVK